MNGAALVVKTDPGNAKLHLELGFLHGRTSRDHMPCRQWKEACAIELS